MKTEHTPGPWWIARTSDLELSFIVGAGDNEHGLIYGKPNALLVKAAPDLLEALRWIASCECEDEGDNDYIYSKAREAIAKATGETE